MGRVEPYHAHLHSPDGIYRGPTTIDATSCSLGATDLDPALSAFGKCCFSLWQGQQAPSLAKLDYLRAKRNFCIFFRA
jgi:hypothetical protein